MALGNRSIASQPADIVDLPRDRLQRAAVSLFFLVLLFLMFAVTRVELVPGPKLRIGFMSPIGGDQIHYSIALEAILFDHTLELQDAYARGHFDHHSIVVNKRTGHHASWFVVLPNLSLARRSYFEKEFAASPDVYEVSAHPIAFPALLAAVLAPFHPYQGDVDRDASLVMVLISWLTVVIVYFVARRIGMGRGFALLAASVLALASPWLGYTRSLFAEPVIGLSLALAIWAFESGCPILCAFAAAAAAIFKPPFALVGVGFIVERIWARKFNDAAVMAVVLGALGAGLVAFNFWLARTPIITGNLGLQPSFSIGPLYRTFLGSAHGLFRFAPWTIYAFVALGLGLLPGSQNSPLRRMVTPMVLFTGLLALDSLGPLYCYGPRYWLPMLPWLAIASVEGLRSKWRSGTLGYGLRTSYASVVLLSSAIAIPGALRFPELSDQPALAPWQMPGGLVTTKSLIAASDFLVGRSSPSEPSAESPVGAARVAGFAETPMVNMVRQLTLESVPATRRGQLLIADLMTYGGEALAIEAPAGWELIRDDSCNPTRQSLYKYIAGSSDQPSTWKFSQPVDAQGVILTIDSAATSDPIDASSGMAWSDNVMAPAATTSDDGDLVLVFFATDFGGIAPNPQLPSNLTEIVNQKTRSHAYWILGGYQAQRGETEGVECPTGQLYNSAAAQVAIKRR